MTRWSPGSVGIVLTATIHLSGKPNPLPSHFFPYRSMCLCCLLHVHVLFFSSQMAVEAFFYFDIFSFYSKDVAVFNV